MNIISRKKKSEIIKKEINNLSDKDIDDMYSIVKNKTNNLVNVESEEDKMKRVMLEIINKILILMNKEQINDICDFVNVRRNELIKNEYLELINKNKDYIFSNGFNKHECQIYQPKIKYGHISILKGMLKQLGHMLKSINYKTIIGGDAKAYTTYSIQKINI
jgi:hypothetical protein